MIDNKAEILIVDDDFLIRQSLAAVLSDKGYTVRLAADGVSALTELKNFKPDVLLSDLDMPGMGGRELLSIVRHRFPGIRTVAMSGAYSGTGVPEGVTADAYFAKGIQSSSRLFEILFDLAFLEPSRIRSLETI